MGDAAEWSIEQGLDELLAHQAGECEGYCPYCDEELKAEQQRKRKKKRKGLARPHKGD